MKLWLLDNGSIVIEHTQLMWNVPGPQVRIPSYAVLIEHDEGSTSSTPDSTSSTRTPCCRSSSRSRRRSRRFRPSSSSPASRCRT